jgi:hypothetical protein
MSRRIPRLLICFFETKPTINAASSQDFPSRFIAALKIKPRVEKQRTADLIGKLPFNDSFPYQKQPICYKKTKYRLPTKSYKLFPKIISYVSSR